MAPNCWRIFKLNPWQALNQMDNTETSNVHDPMVLINSVPIILVWSIKFRVLVIKPYITLHDKVIDQNYLSYFFFG